MKLKKMYLYVAGLVAMLIGFPMSEKAFAGVTDIVDSSLGLAGAIASASDAS